MPSLSKTYPFPHNQCDHCGQAFPTRNGVRRHIGHSPHCKTAALQNSTTRRTARRAEVVGALTDDGDHQDVQIHANTDSDIPDLDINPDIRVFSGQEGGVTDHLRYVGKYNEGHAANVLGSAKTGFESMKDLQDASGQGAYAPFKDRGEWELAQWLVQNVNQRATDEFLKLSITRERTQPTYKSKYTFMRLVDQLPTGPEWECELVSVRGDSERSENAEEKGDEELELWLRDPVACVRELIGNPAFKNEMAYAPERVYTDPRAETRRYDETWTGDWWWQTQSRLPAGATVAPVILASDKTELSRFKGDKMAWPVYLTIGNISKHVRRKPALHASILVGYLPVSKLDAFENTSVAKYRLFHYCMRRLVQPLVAAGREGVDMVCSDGLIRRVYPLLAAFIGDHPEQCLVGCCAENRCPKCHVPADQRGNNFEFPCRNQGQTTRVLQAQAAGEYPPEFIAEGLRPVFSPFWADLPHSDIFTCITSDILHQLHQGIIKDHLKKWCVAVAGKKALDTRFQATPTHPGLRHWKNGVSDVKQWTGSDHKQLERVFVTALVGTTPNHNVIRASRALLDFIYLAQYHSHTDDTLQALQDALNEFHALKDVFIELGCREHFNIPKFHSLVHYVQSIRLFGSLDGFNTENSERLHIDYAKKAYAATNRKDYTIQMTKWLNRQEAVIWFRLYLGWRGLLDSGPAGESADEDSDNTNEPTPEVDRGRTQTLYQIAHRPHFPRRTAQFLVQHHGAVMFVEALQSFLANLPYRGPRVFQPTLYDCFDCFSNVRLPLQALPHLPDNETMRVRSHPERGNGPRKPPTLAQYDTVLVQVDDEGQGMGGLQGKSIICNE